jgi:hypothetical protein
MRCTNAGMTGKKSTDEPKNPKELERHPDKLAIISSTQKKG